MNCGRSDCTGNHSHYPNLCPRRIEADWRNRTPEMKERDKAQKREHYAALGGYAYAHLLLKHRRTKALTRIDKRRH